MRFRRNGLSALTVALAAVASMSTVTAARAEPPGRWESVYSTSSPVSSVVSSVVTLAAPLPPGSPPHPAACDTLS